MSKREIYEQKTEEILNPIMEELEFELVDVEYVKEGSMKIANQEVSSGELAVIEDWEHPVELKNEAEATAKAGICKVKTV